MKRNHTQRSRGRRNNSQRGRRKFSIHQNRNNKRRADEEPENNREKVFKRKEEEDVQNNVEEDEYEDDEPKQEDTLGQLRSCFKASTSTAAVSSDSEEDDDEPEEGANDLDNANSDTDSSEDETKNKVKLAKAELKALREEEKIEYEEAADDVAEEDPFTQHFAYDLGDTLLNSVQNVPQIVDTCEKFWEELGKIHIQIPKCNVENNDVKAKKLLEEEKFASGGKVPEVIKTNKIKLNDLYIKKQIQKTLHDANTSLSALNKNKVIPFTKLQTELFSIFNQYQDLYYPQRTFDNAEEIRFAYCLHAMNHTLKTRTKVLSHNQKINKLSSDDIPNEYRDQGLVRPKVLIILPFRDAAYKTIRMLTSILCESEKGSVVNKNRFKEEFTGQELWMPQKNPKPEDYEKLFTGNVNDNFKVGIKITKKTLKIYSEFYSSDMIIASPIALRTLIGAKGERYRQFDFLSSVEVLIIDQTDVFLMQNWDHLLHIFNHLHLQPKSSHGIDFRRVRSWCLNGWSKYYRQTLIFSSIQLPEINSIFNKHCFNFAGKLKVANPIVDGAMNKVHVPMQHFYQKFTSSNPKDVIEERFKYFVQEILPKHRESQMRQTMVYVANYFDFVKLRNHFRKEDIPFVQACEYSEEGKVTRARDMFYHGDTQFMLYTERYHFFNRKKIKGIRHLVFYQPPNIPHFYYEMCNLMQEANMNRRVGTSSNMSVTVLYSKYDVMQLSAIIGTERAMKIIASERNVHMLLTD